MFTFCPKPRAALNCVVYGPEGLESATTTPFPASVSEVVLPDTVEQALQCFAVLSGDVEGSGGVDSVSSSAVADKSLEQYVSSRVSQCLV
jgi:hypothetical protein